MQTYVKPNVFLNYFSTVPLCKLDSFNHFKCDLGKLELLELTVLWQEDAFFVYRNICAGNMCWWGIYSACWSLIQLTWKLYIIVLKIFQPKEADNLWLSDVIDFAFLTQELKRFSQLVFMAWESDLTITLKTY